MPERTRHRPRRRPGLERETLAGVHPVAEALRARRRRLYCLRLRDGVREASATRPLAEQARALGVPVELLAPETFDRQVPAGVRAQGILLEAGPLPAAELEELAAASAPRRVVALDGVEDPQNLGAVARVAESAGTAGLLLPERRAAPLRAAAARASAGALEFLPVVPVPNLRRALSDLKARGFFVIGADADQGDDLYGLPQRLVTADLVLVLGSEGRGLRSSVRVASDLVVRIPTQGRVASLNVATAAAVILFEWRRRLRVEPLSGAGSP